MKRALFLLPLSALLAAASGGDALSALIVGGGSDVRSNAAQIEGHTRFVASLLPAEGKRALLFANGRAQEKTVSYSDATPQGEARRAMQVLLPDAWFKFGTASRPPSIGLPIDGPASPSALRRMMGTILPRLQRVPGEPLLLYFAGHGSQQTNSGSTTSTYQFWKSERLAVRDLAAQVARVPGKTPVVLVMAQCYSGGFADLLFSENARANTPISQNFAAFFSARRDRMASGCGWETGEADYQDFSSHFFAALAGRDQFGHEIGGADYDGDGAVTLHEAFCYTLIRDDSMDTPNCTSDLYLTRAWPLAERHVDEVPYSVATSEATPAQRAVLEALSTRLELEGETRALVAYDRLTFRDPQGRATQLAAARAADDHLNSLREQHLADLFQRHPDLRWSDDSQDFDPAAEAAVRELTESEEKRRALLEASKASEQANGALENEEAFLMRFLDVYRSVVLARDLRQHGGETEKKHFARIWAAEQQVLPLRRAASEAVDK